MIPLVLALLLAASQSAPAPAPPNALAETVEPFVIESGGVRIAGEVHRDDPRRCTAVIVVGGSNVRTRIDTAAATAFLLDRETAIVHMDRRGNGLSTGKFAVPGTLNTRWQIPGFGRDVAAVARYLKRQGYPRVVLIGTSMGGWIDAAAAAAAPDAIDAIVSMSGGASTVGVSDEFDRLAASGLTLVEAAERARVYRGPPGYDPRPDLARVRQPILWVFGARDASNPTALDLAEVRRGAEQGKPWRWLVLANADHEFVDVDSHQFNASWVAPVRRFIRGETSAGSCATPSAAL